jgi:hypothetical protein
MPRSKKTSPHGKAYLTKRITARAAKSGFKQAAQETIKIMGFSIEAQGDWLVKKFPDGRVEKLERIAKAPKKIKIFLD